MSPILVRPVREQLEHDRLIRHLQTKFKRKFDVAVNLGDEQAAPVKIGPTTFFPDLILNEGKRPAALVEVESAESVNNLEAMAQWVHFSRARVPFHLYVPANVYDAARRLCEANGATVSEIWTYRAAIDGFDLIRMFHGPGPSARNSQPVTIPKPAAPVKPVAAEPPPPPAPPPPPPPKPAAAAAAKSAKRPPAKPAKPAKAAKPAKPARKAAKAPPKRPAARTKARSSKR